MKSIYVLFFACISFATAQTTVQGDVFGTWTKAASPYLVIANATVPNAKTLIIEPGAQVKLSQGVNLTIVGSLQAVGTASDSIKFTTAETVPAAGQWGQLQFTSGSGSLSYCIVEYGGRGDIYAIDASQLRITNSTIRGNSNGVYLESSNAAIGYSIVSDNSRGIKSSSGIIDNCVISRNSLVGIWASAGRVNITKSSILENSTGVISSDNASVIVTSSIIQRNSYGFFQYNFSGFSWVSCVIESCIVSDNSGGLYANAQSITLKRTLIRNNSGSGVQNIGANSLIENSTIVANKNGITEIRTGDNVLIHNNIIAYNGGDGLNTTGTVPSVVFNNVFSNNMNYSGFSSLYGKSSIRNHNGDSADVFSNISFDPSFADTTTRDFRLRQNSKMINAGDTLSARDPDGTIADLGVYFLPTGGFIEASATSVNFDTVIIGRTKSIMIKVRNQGSSTLSVDSISSPLGEFTFSPQSFIVAPLDSATLTITFSPVSRGIKSAVIKLANSSTNAPSLSISALGIGKGYPKIVLNKSELHFRSVYINRSRIDTIEIANIGNDNLNICKTIVGTDSGSFSLSPAVLSIPPASSTLLLVTFTPVTFGSKSASLRLTTNDTLTATVLIPMNGQVSLQPKITRIKDVPNDHGKRVIIEWTASTLDTNINTLPFYSIWRVLPRGTQVQGASISPQYITENFKHVVYRFELLSDINYTWEWIANEPAHRLQTYAFTATTLYDSTSTTDGKHYFFVSAHTNNPNVFYDSDVDSGYSVNNIGSSTGINAKAISFGNVKVGTFKDTTITITNTGNDTLKINNITSSRSTFTARPTVKNVPPGQSLTDTLRFAPITVGTDSALVVIQSNSRSSPDTLKVSGIAIPTTSVEGLEEIPTTFALNQNYPNPFNPSTTLRYALAVNSAVHLTIFSTLGQQVAELVNQQENAGWHVVEWNANVSSGTYFYRIEAIDVNNANNRFVETKRMLLIK
jgi:hypothetical protein